MVAANNNVLFFETKGEAMATEKKEAKDLDEGGLGLKPAGQSGYINNAGPTGSQQVITVDSAMFDFVRSSLLRPTQPQVFYSQNRLDMANEAICNLIEQMRNLGLVLKRAIR